MSAVEQQQGMLVMLVGPGGVGKNALMKDVQKRFPHIGQLATATTRPPRDNEQHGVHHLFVSLEEFQRMIADDELLEYQEVTPGKFYGVPRTLLEDAFSDGRVLIADIEYLGAEILKNAYPDNVMTVFIAPPSREALIKRMELREDDPITIQQRMERMVDEMRYAPSCDYLVVNDDIETAVNELCDVVEAKFNGKPVVSFVNQVSYAVEVRPQAEGRVLVCNGELPKWNVLHTRKPLDDFVVEMIQESFSQVEIDNDRLKYGVSDDKHPVEINYSASDHRYQLLYHYIYHLSEHISPPGGWSWRTTD